MKRPRPLFRARIRGDVLMITPQHCRESNYLPMVDALIARERGRLKPGQVHQVTIRHDGWCDHFRGRACNCTPNVQLAESASPASS